MIKTYPKNSEVQLSENFKLSEFHCHCHYPECIVTYLDSDLIDYLQAKRTEVAESFKINSGFRCTRHNHDEHGKSGSFHLLGKAADVVVNGYSVLQMSVLFSDADGMGIYQTDGFVHVDKRGYRSRWKG